MTTNTEETGQDRVFGQLMDVLGDALDLSCRADRDGRVAEIQRLCAEARSLSLRLERRI
jgi:hypothetical protein